MSDYQGWLRSYCFKRPPQYAEDFGKEVWEHQNLRIAELEQKLAALAEQKATAMKALFVAARERQEVEQQLTELREEIQAVRNWLDLEHLQRKAGSALLKQEGEG